MSKAKKSIISLALMLSLLLALITLTPLQASAEGYLSFEEAAAVVRDKMSQRDSGEFTVKFTLKDSRQYPLVTVEDMLFEEAQKHNGVSNQGDYLVWSMSSWGGNRKEDSFDGTTHYYTFRFADAVYYSTAENEAVLADKIASVLKELNLSGKSDYEKVKAIYDYVCAHVVYDMDAAMGDTSIQKIRESYSAYGALINGKATCQGYATLMYRLLLEAGIDNRIVTGDSHGWNIVKLDGKYYCLDATWDAGAEEYKWFLEGYSHFWTLGHTPNAGFFEPEYADAYPVATLDYGVQEPAADAVLGSGTVPNSEISWALTGDGTMTFSGTGVIGSYFSGSSGDAWDGLNSYVKKVVIGDGITGIGEYAFRGMTQLESVSVPASVTFVGSEAFKMCTSLKEILLPDSITGIGMEAFFMCTALEKITLPAGLTEIADRAFYGCISLPAIHLPEGVSSIGNYAFAACTSLTGFTFPRALTSIGYYAFYSAFDKDSYVSITIPATVTSVGEYSFEWSCLSELNWQAATPLIPEMMFAEMHYLKKVVIGEGVTEIGNQAFQGCANLVSATLPESLRTVGYSLFNECKSLRDVVLHEGLEVMSNGMFSGCASLETLTVPASVTTLGGFVDEGCTRLESIWFLGDPPASDVRFPFMHFIGYYPADNPAWTEAVLQGFDLGISWVAYTSAGSEHTLSDWQYDTDSHWRSCSHCDEKFSYSSPHIFNADGWSEGSACLICGYNKDTDNVNPGTNTTVPATDPTESTTPAVPATDPTESTTPTVSATDSTESTSSTTPGTAPGETTSPTMPATDPTESVSTDPTVPAAGDTPEKPSGICLILGIGGAVLLAGCGVCFLVSKKRK